MRWAIVHSGATAAALQDGWRLPREHVAAFSSALGLLEFAERRAAEADQECRLKAARAERAGYDAGVAKGRLEHQAATARSIAALAQEVRELQRAQRAAVGELALDVVRRIAGGLERGLLVQHLAAEALRDMVDERPFALRIAPGAEQALADELRDLGDGLRLIPDASLAPDACIFETHAGRVDASLEVQLSALREAFAAVGERPGA